MVKNFRSKAAKGWDEAFGILTDECEGVFLAIAIDVVDPGMATGIGTREPGGLISKELLEAVRRSCVALPIVGIAVIEVTPAYDSPEITAYLANRVVLGTPSSIVKRHSGTKYSAGKNLLEDRQELEIHLLSLMSVTDQQGRTHWALQITFICHRHTHRM